MSGYTPRVGDKVRATLGESVIVGEVVWVGESGVDVQVPGNVEQICLWSESAWHLEQVVSVPSKPWALVGHPTDTEYVPYIRTPEGKWFEITSDGDSFLTREEVVAGYLARHFSVLFDGVDE